MAAPSEVEPLSSSTEEKINRVWHKIGNQYDKMAHKEIMDIKDEARKSKKTDKKPTNRERQTPRICNTQKDIGPSTHMEKIKYGRKQRNLWMLTQRQERPRVMVNTWTTHAQERKQMQTHLR